MAKSTHSPDEGLQLSKCFTRRCQYLGRCRSFESKISGKRCEF